MRSVQSVLRGLKHELAMRVCVGEAVRGHPYSPSRRILRNRLLSDLTALTAAVDARRSEEAGRRKAPRRPLQLERRQLRRGRAASQLAERGMAR